MTKSSQVTWLSCSAQDTAYRIISSRDKGSNSEDVSISGSRRINGLNRSVLHRDTDGRLRMTSNRSRYERNAKVHVEDNLDRRCDYEPTSLKHIKEMLMNTWADLAETRSKKKVSQFVVGYFERRIMIYNDLLRSEFERHYNDPDSDELTIVESDSELSKGEYGFDGSGITCSSEH
ncbi:uncharacterized protein LOC111268373 [Varroa jacobsoni]|uniref:uncharacterized protein LOC111268373 n=1 Tax=Varroa jacobsoni TaxID=62625 RepID=UPI000BF7418A|nr:uncharacterized protein LOC111268373 [Varroa jacobsoni]XP_022703090.1 uncharacterized protein LOC111268373 [Varroa jacobsoni]